MDVKKLRDAINSFKCGSVPNSSSGYATVDDVRKLITKTAETLTIFVNEIEKSEKQ